ncbi:DoxX family protein [Nocardioides sp. JQ2195]|uniref:DoxX family protein n=1 Tax=Nocardioides sp. JQ2195 TaxID=2592334 RepID=UPI00143E16AC|nr:DoxX family protein [Nocardioides sp. JQ2195]QIX28305.1 DoxX family protein [Nocardioides sp. JQ2195]
MSTQTLTGSTTSSTRDTSRTFGLVLTGLVSLFLAVDAISHLLNVQTAQDWNQKYGAPGWFAYPLGIALTISLITYLVPRTAVLGAVLLTGYLGGAMAVNIFINDQAVFGAAFAFIVAVLAWGGLWLRDDRVKVLYTR